MKYCLIIFLVLFVVTVGAYTRQYYSYKAKVETDSMYLIDNQHFHSCSAFKAYYYPKTIDPTCTFTVIGIMNGEPTSHCTKNNFCIMTHDAPGNRNIFQYNVTASCDGTIYYDMYYCNSEIDQQARFDEQAEYWTSVFSQVYHIFVIVVLGVFVLLACTPFLMKLRKSQRTRY